MKRSELETILENNPLVLHDVLASMSDTDFSKMLVKYCWTLECCGDSQRTCPFYSINNCLRVF